MHNRDSIVNQHVRWSWGEKLLRASLDTPLETEPFINIFYIKHRNLINTSITCGTTVFRFNEDGVAEFDAQNYNDAETLTKFHDCEILKPGV